MKHPDDFYYRLDIQYLGFRYHGWQKQPNVKTVQLMLEKTINFVLNGEVKFKVIASSRTDAMVSANQLVIQLIVNRKLDTNKFILELNENLPSDIKALSITPASAQFNAIHDVISKEYIYQFTFLNKPSPYSAPFLAFFREDLNIQSMKEGCELFIGSHNFSAFTDTEKEKDFNRTIDVCRLEEVKEEFVSHLPSEYYRLIISAKGFMKYQIRFMVGALVALGCKAITKEDIQHALEYGGDNLAPKAPASGLILNKVHIK